jgi:prepilin-type N-terminal cleavage/methylation domain-containing protein
MRRAHTLDSGRRAAPVAFQDPPMRRHRQGFTLIELLIVCVIIGILAAFAVVNQRNSRKRAAAASMKSDLRNIAYAEEAYFSENRAYTSDLARLFFDPSPGVSVTFGTVNGLGWAAQATHAQADPGTCAIFAGSVTPMTPATAEGTIACQ